MAAASFFFQILLASWKGALPDVVNRSIVVEVCPNAISRASLAGEKEKTEREFAEAIARRAATEIIQGEFGSSSEPVHAIAQIGALPDEIREQSPTLQRADMRAWLL
jgi:hypothetical protein